MSPAKQGHLAMLLFSVLVAGSFSLGALAANEIAPGALNAVRFAIASIVIGAAVLATGGVQRSALNAPWRYLLLGGIFGTYFVLMFEGLKTAPPVSAAAVFTLTPIMAAGNGWLLMHQNLPGDMLVASLSRGFGATWMTVRACPWALLAFKTG